MIKLTHQHTYSGTNIYSTESAIVVLFEIEKEELKIAKNNILSVKHSLSNLFESYVLKDFVTELELGDFIVSFAHILLTEVRGFINTAKSFKNDDQVVLILGYHVPKVSLLALKVALNIYINIEKLNSSDLNKILIDFWDICRKYHPDYQAGILMEACYKKNIPVLPFINGTKFWQYGWGEKSRIFMESRSNTDGSIAHTLSNDKPITKAVFNSLGVPTPKDVVIKSSNELETAIAAIGYPCVLKPTNTGGGKGVIANIRNFTQLLNAFTYARQFTKDAIMVERFICGDDYRLMVIDGKFVAAIKREPAKVIGNGKSAIRELIQQLNSKRSINLRKSNYLRPILIDKILLEQLAKQEMSLDNILSAERHISLRSNANLSTGGTCTDVTHLVHPTITQCVEQLSVTTGFGTAGFDYITTDISSSLQKSGGAFIEMNTTPGLDVTIAAGWSVEKIGSITLGDTVGRIPIHLHISNTPLDLYKLPINFDSHLARVSENNVCIGQCCYHIDDLQPWAAVKSVLRNKTVQVVEIFCTVSEIIKHGMPVDYVNNIFISNIDIPENWMNVLKEHASEIIFH
uniref:D-alanine-D-alanine ligase and related ATP-grasp enzymes-like protein n=1 Tax=Chlorobium chlorochromatii (strain CaD3) TaxID=340177 RepID=Q3AS13_CHLCH